jgi:hypothetical protein
VQLEGERSCAREPLGGGLDKPPLELEVVATGEDSVARLYKVGVVRGCGQGR